MLCIRSLKALCFNELGLTVSEFGKMSRTVAFMVLAVVMIWQWQFALVLGMFILFWSGPFMVCHLIMNRLRRDE